MVTRLSPEEAQLIDYHVDRLKHFRRRNKIKNDRYEAKNRLQNADRNLPPHLRAVKLAVGFTGTVIDVLEERLEFLGWTGPDGNDPHGLAQVYMDNDLDVESSAGHLDGLITGSGFAIVGKGDVGEPDALITVESSDRVTGEWDRRTRRLSSAISVDLEKDGDIQEVTLYLLDSNIQAKRLSGTWVEIDRDDHGSNRVHVVQLPNRPRGSRPGGRSEITPALAAYTDEAVESLLGMKVHRAFYQAPQRYILNANESWFQTADGSRVSGWEAVQGRMLAVPAGDEDDPEPEIGQFEPSSPLPYIQMIRGYAELVSAEGAIPLTYLGLSTANPPSADAIRALESRLIKKAERRQATFGRGWREIGALALLIKDGAIPDDYNMVTTKWSDAATPTRSAAADEVTKYVGAGILPATSTVTYDRMGLDPAEQRTLTNEKRREDANTRRDAIAQAATAARLAGQQPAPAAPNVAPEVTPNGQ